MTGGRPRRVVLRRQPLSTRRWWSLAIICVAMGVLTGSSIGYTSYADGEREKAERAARVALERQEREADRRWCLLLTTLNRAYSSTPPATQLGREVAAAILALTLELDCPER